MCKMYHFCFIFFTFNTLIACFCRLLTKKNTVKTSRFWPKVVILIQGAQFSSSSPWPPLLPLSESPILELTEQMESMWVKKNVRRKWKKRSVHAGLLKFFRLPQAKPYVRHWTAEGTRKYTIVFWQIVLVLSCHVVVVKHQDEVMYLL